jgi:hypothetical protein
LLDAVSAGTRALPDIRLAGLSRLANAGRWGEAVASGLGWVPATFSYARSGSTSSSTASTKARRDGVAMTEDGHTSERDRGRSLIDLSFRAHIEH